MHHRRTINCLFSLCLAALLFLQPLLYALQLVQLTNGWFPRTVSIAHAQEPAQDDTNTYLPVISNGSQQSTPTATQTPEPDATDTPTPTATSTPPAATPTATATTPAENLPSFEITSPLTDQSVAGYIFFAIEQTEAVTITSVSFKAGDQELGTDNDGTDGFKIFVNTKDLQAGANQFSATVNGPSGQSTKSVTAQVVPDPPTSATIDKKGGVLASETGSVISILPGSVPDGTTITVDELTAEETATRHGLDWQRMGVTFLGAQDVQSSVPISKPFGAAASAGFGDRVQQGQAVVNYRIVSDADGDGVDEIVMLNTASVAPNGDVLANSKAVPNVGHLRAVSSNPNQNPQTVDKIIGIPGAIFEIEAQGFNAVSALGTIAQWQSVLDGIKYEVTCVVLPDSNGSANQKVIIIVPPLRAGQATLTLKNLSTGSTTEPIDVEIKEPPALNKSSAQIIDEFLSELSTYFGRLPASSAEQWAAKRTLDMLKQAKTSFQDIANGASTPDLTKSLDNMAKMIANSGIIEMLGSSADDSNQNIGYGLGISSAISTVALSAAALGTDSIRLTSFGNTLDSAIALGATGHLICLWWDTGNCFVPPPSDPGGRGTTGMGAVPPRGGNGSGNAKGNSNQRIPSGNSQQPSPIMVKIFANGNATPFTGMTDPGGYFFVPFIPADEPFTAVAIDTATGDTRTFTGIGPQTGESVFMFFDFFNEEQFVPTIQWDGGGDGLSWHDPLNWDTDQVPAASDRVLVDVSGDKTVTFSQGNTTLLSLFSAENIEFTGGSLTLNAKSTISGSLTMRGGFKLTVDGLGASFTATNSAVAAGASLFAQNGGRIVLPNLNRLDGDGGNFRTTLQASGGNSLLDLSAVTLLTGNTFVNDGLIVQALAGGQINLSSVAAIDTGKVQFTADGDNSTINLSALTRFERRGRGGSFLNATNGGTIAAARLTEMVGIGMTLDGTGTVATAQITTFTGGRAEVIGITPDFSGMTDVDGSSFLVKNGGQISLPRVTSYTGDGPGSSFRTTLAVEGANSLLDLSTFATFGGNTFVNDGLIVTALKGGKIDLSNVASIGTGMVQFTADGTESIIDLSALTGFERGGRGESFLKPVLNGVILADQLTKLHGVSLFLDGTGTLATGQITDFTSGKAEVTAITPDFNNMTNVGGSSFIAKSGGQILLPAVTSFAGDGLQFRTLLSADGTNSVIDLSAAISLTGNTFVNDWLTVQALAGGKVDLSSVPEIDVGMVQFSADGTASVVDLSSLTRFAKGGRGGSLLDAKNSGHIELNGNDLTVERAGIHIGESGTIAVGAVVLDADSLLKGTGAMPGDVTNNGATEPGDSPGGLAISSAFTQTASGKYIIEIGGTIPGSSYDQLAVSGAVILTGTLDIKLINAYEPNIGDSFIILTGSSVAGTFSQVTGQSIGNGKQFQVSYATDRVTLEVVAQ